MIFGEFFSRDVGEVSPFAQEFDQRSTVIETGDADHVVDIVAVQAERGGGEDIVVPAFFQFVGGQYYRVGTVYFLFRNELKIMACDIEDAARSAIEEGDCHAAFAGNKA